MCEGKYNSTVDSLTNPSLNAGMFFSSHLKAETHAHKMTLTQKSRASLTSPNFMITAAGAGSENMDLSLSACREHEEVEQQMRQEMESSLTVICSHFTQRCAACERTVFYF